MQEKFKDKSLKNLYEFLKIKYSSLNFIGLYKRIGDYYLMEGFYPKTDFLYHDMGETLKIEDFEKLREIFKDKLYLKLIRENSKVLVSFFSKQEDIEKGLEDFIKEVIKHEHKLPFLFYDSEDKFYEGIKKWFEEEGIEGYVRFFSPFKSVKIEAFKDVVYDYSIKRDFGIEIFIEHPLKDFIREFLFSIFLKIFYEKEKMYFERTKEKLKKHRDELFRMENKKLVDIMKDYSGIEKITNISLFSKGDWIDEVSFEKRELLFFPLFYFLKELYHKDKNKFRRYVTFLDSLFFLYSKVQTVESQEHLKEVVYFTLKEIYPGINDFFFFYSEHKKDPPVFTIYSFDIDPFFYKELYEIYIPFEAKKLSFRGSKINLYYSNFTGEDRGVLGVLSKDEITDPLVNNILELFSFKLVLFYLKKEIRNVFYIYRKFLPIMTVKIRLLQKRFDKNILNSLDKFPVRINLKEVIKKSLDLLDFEIKRKNINVEIEGPDVMFEGDYELLSIGFTNLFSYLVQYNRIRGFLKIELGSSYIIIKDSGIGLTEKEIEEIVDPVELETPLNIVGSIFKAHFFETFIDVERGIGNTVNIFFK